MAILACTFHLLSIFTVIGLARCFLLDEIQGTTNTMTPATQSVTPVTSTNLTEVVCQDKISTCTNYGRAMCTAERYQPWAHANCALYCGYCTPPNPMHCDDKLPNCDEFDSGDLCTSPDYYAWTYENCRHYCRLGHCNAASCHDTMDCQELDTSVQICQDTEEARLVCQNFCGLCDIADGHWEGWSTWSTCDVTCGDGYQVRARECIPPIDGGLPCNGSALDAIPCTMKHCSVEGGWSAWGLWSTCNVTCGFGLRSRERVCNSPEPAYLGNHCFGSGVEYTVCHQGPCTAQGWSSWDSWGDCSNIGYRTRYRTCQEPLLYLLDWLCRGPEVETQVCNVYTVGNRVKCRPNSCTGSVNNVRLCGGHVIPTPSCGPSRHCFESNGRVEVYYNDTWGTVCSDSWTASEAQIVCRMFGYGHGRSVTHQFSGGSGPILLRNVTCDGTENSLQECSGMYLDSGFDNCTDSRGAEVVCSL